MDIKKFFPGHGRRIIENAHGMIIELRKQKTEILENPFGFVRGEGAIEVIEEKIRQWEEVIKLWSGKMDPSRNKLIWSVLMPIFISIVVPILLFHVFGLIPKK